MSTLTARALALLALLALISAHAQDQVVQRYQGTGLQNLRPFTVEDNWEVRWNARGDLFSLYLHDAEGNMLDVSANQMGSGSGATFVPQAGTYYFQVNALGAWDLEIAQVNPASFPVITSQGREYTGNGARGIRPFITEGPWEVTWNARGDFFSLYLFGVRGNMLAVGANQMSPGTGSSYNPRAGQYYYFVNALGPWSIRITSID